MRRYASTFLLALAVLIAGCDSAGPEHDADPEPHFELTLGAPINASIEGEAALSDNTSFDEQTVLVLPARRGQTVTALQLFGEGDDGVTHSLSFMYFADEAITEGTYEVGLAYTCKGSDRPTECTPRTLPPDEWLMAQYTRLKDDSLYTYGLKVGGTLTVDRATENVVEGTFALEATSEASMSRADLEAFQDSLRNNPPEDGNWEDLPEPPPINLQPLEPPLTIEGTFTATPASLSNRIPSSSWMITGITAMP